MKHIEKGYTLIELMIVVAIIGILASVALPVYLNYTIRTEVSEAINLTGSAKTAATAYFQDRGTFPPTNSEAGVSDPDTIQGKYVESVTVAGKVITVQFGNDANAQLNGETITLTANTSAIGSVYWNCASGGVIPDKHLPAVCRAF